ncbi:FecR domain-containing protein [Algoriphagus sp. H41]|uniref:FecR domain-containing protein n=1 Tax=Algoriphagus oliviformis TaxID=2811231 RepID=A0ABS3C3A1_9BACT|nr:FecR domain-containing protein [Algoriphagus oliviformis]MBN7811061.1 FecR domain-containing protein [Algoriphagus oliviformis]
MQNDQDYLDRLEESEKVALKNKMFEAIRKEIEVRDAQDIRRMAAWRKAKIAASFAVLLISAFSVWLGTGRKEVLYQTGADEILELRLPDSSSVTLNSHSTLSYSIGRMSGFDRKVTLEGEAFFSIEKDPEGRTFEVNGGSNLGITVLGTQFSVKNTGAVDKVTLIEGSVMLGYEGKNGNAEHLMTPGESVKVNPDAGELQSRRLTHPEKLISWKDRRLKMDNERLPEVLGTLAELYDLRLSTLDLPASETAVSGSLPLSDSPEEVLENLGILFNTSIRLKDQTVTLTNDITTKR